MGTGPVFLEFKSDAFPIEPGEDEQTNPGIFGKALATWIGEQLRAAGTPAGDAFAEDFGWCVPVAAKPYRLYVVCASDMESPGAWKLFVFAEGGFASRLLGRDRRAEVVDGLLRQITAILQRSDDVTDLREDPS
jgi:hypothetical protein